MDLASPFDHTVGEAAALIHYPILTIYDAAIPITQIVVIRGVIVMSNGAVPMGVCYSPYHQQGGPGPGYTEADVEADMAIIAKHFHSIRTYTVQFANIYNVRAASKHNLKVCLGAWIFQGDWSRTQSEITTAAEQVFEHPGTVVHFIVGNEVDRPKLNYTPGEVLQAMKYARKTLDGYGPNDIPVTVCFTGTVLQPGNPSSAIWSETVNACEKLVYLTVYPWYGNSPPGNIDPNMQWSYDHGMKQVEARGKQVVIGEIGWPSAGGRETSVENEKLNFGVTNAWVLGKNPLNKPYEAFWFEMFDEPWKTEEGPGVRIGACTDREQARRQSSHFPFAKQY
jgi:exo-beta-1,3-glucanase (GH17 family)